MTSKLSDTRIRSETALWAKKVSDLTNKINAKSANQKDLQKQIEDIDNSINDARYLQAKNSYEDLNNQINAIKAKYNKSKSKATKNKYLTQINNLKSQKSGYSQQMKAIAKEKGFANKLSKRASKSRNLALLKQLINDLKTQRSKAKSNQNYYEGTSLSRQRAK